MSRGVHLTGARDPDRLWALLPGSWLYPSPRRLATGAQGGLERPTALSDPSPGVPQRDPLRAGQATSRKGEGCLGTPVGGSLRFGPLLGSPRSTDKRISYVGR